MNAVQLIKYQGEKSTFGLSHEVIYVNKTYFAMRQF